MQVEYLVDGLDGLQTLLQLDLVLLEDANADVVGDGLDQVEQAHAQGVEAGVPVAECGGMALAEVGVVGPGLDEERLSTLDGDDVAEDQLVPRQHFVRKDEREGEGHPVFQGQGFEA